MRRSLLAGCVQRSAGRKSIWRRVGRGMTSAFRDGSGAEITLPCHGLLPDRVDPPKADMRGQMENPAGEGPAGLHDAFCAGLGQS